MSLNGDVVVAGSNSFWEVECYRRTVKRTEDGIQMCGEVMKMLQERADIEKDYAKRLKAWTKKWNEAIDKGQLILVARHRCSLVNIKLH